MLPTPSYMSLCLFLDFFSPPHLHVDPEGLLGVICALNLSPHVLAVVYDAHVPLPSQRSMVPVLVYKTRQYPACKNGFMHTAVPSASASACMCVQKPSALIQESSSLSQSGTRIQVAVRFFFFFTGNELLFHRASCQTRDGNIAMCLYIRQVNLRPVSYAASGGSAVFCADIRGPVDGVVRARAAM